MDNFGYENSNGGDNIQNHNGDGTQESQQKSDLNNPGAQYDANGNPITPINKQGSEGDDNHNGDDNHDGDDNNGNGDDSISLQAGEVIEIGENSYTVADNGDLLDKDGNVFKEAKDVEEFLKQFNVASEEEHNNDDDKNKSKGINIEDVQKALGYEMVDDENKPIVYNNDIEGIKSYVNDVMEQRTSEIQEITLNTFFERFPFVQNMVNYYIANGNSLDGWGQELDRSTITIDDENERQQEEIIRAAWKENKRTGDLESYISYLKSSGTLLSTAKTELEGLQQADEARKKELQEKAEAARQEEEAQMAKFWKGIEDSIKGRTIGQYRIPEQIKVMRNGKTVMATPDDFYRYVSVADKDGETAYAKDCKTVKQEQQIEDSLLKAYMMFTGGSYSSLVDMAIKEEKVKTLRLKAKENTQPVRRFTPKGNSKNDNKPDFGYNR